MQLQLPNELPWQEICSWMGYPSHQQPDPQTISLAQQASKIVLDSAQPRGVFQRDGLYTNEQGTIMWRQMPLLGEDIGLHLKHCTHAVWMAVTIGTKTEMQLRRIAKDVALSYAVDAAAGLLAEKLADQLQAFVQEQLQQGEYMTIRYSPGYGDFPIETQRDVVRMLDTQKQMGLTVNSGGILIPRKSITAICGISNQPVKGRLAGCNHCLLREKCKYRKEGKYCGQS